MGLIAKSLQFREDLRQFILGWISPETLASEKARADLNNELKEHWKPRTIEAYELILENWEPDRSTENEWFVVFIDIDLDVDWINNGKTDAESDRCISLAESIGAQRCNHLPRDQVLEFKRLVGQSIVNGINGEAKQACKLAETAAQFLKDRTVERSRSWTLVSAHYFFFLFSAILIYLYENGVLPKIEDSLLPWLAVQGGIVGAYLSVIQKAGRGEWDAAAGRYIHYIEVFTKLFAGSILGGLALVLSRSVHAPASVKAITPDGYSIFAFGVAAGWLERLIPKMISHYSAFENDLTNRHHETKSNTH